MCTVLGIDNDKYEFPFTIAAGRLPGIRMGKGTDKCLILTDHFIIDTLIVCRNLLL